MVLMATQVKRRRGTTAENDAFTGAEGEIVVDTERHELRVHDGVKQGGFRIGGGSGRNIGDIFMTKRTDTSLAGAVECDGATYNTTDFTGTESIGELLEAGKLDYVSLTAYSTAISTKGWCDKIGWDGTGNTQFRVPTLNAHIVQTNNIPVIGNGIVIGITDGTHDATFVQTNKSYAPVHTQKAGYGEQVGQTATTVDDVVDAWKGLGITTDPTKSGIIADTTDTAQLRVMIQLAVSATDEALETCTSVLADVANLFNNKVDLSSSWGFPDGSYDDIAFGASGTIYTAPGDGWFQLRLTNTGLTNNWVNISYRVNDTNILIGNFWAQKTNNSFGLPLIPAKKGLQLKIDYGADISGASSFRFFYAQKSN